MKLIELKEKLINFQRFIIKKKEEGCQLRQIANADQTTAYFDMLIGYAAKEKGAKEVKQRTASYEKQQATVIP